MATKRTKITHCVKVIASKEDANDVLPSVIDQLSTADPNFKNKSIYNLHIVHFESGTVPVKNIESLTCHQNNLLHKHDMLVNVDNLHSIKFPMEITYQDGKCNKYIFTNGNRQ